MMEDIKKTELESENVNITEEPEDVVEVVDTVAVG